MRLWYCDQHDFPLPPGHKFPLAKYRLIREALTLDGRFALEPAPFALPEAVALVHDAPYIQGFIEGTLDPRIMRRIGFPWSPELVTRTLASVGGTLGAARDAVNHGWGGTLAGGTHHAFPNEGSGFCVFNDIAVAVRVLQDNGYVRRVAIIDLDVHQGDGTAVVFRDDPDVFTLSVHGRDNFPFRKQISRIDIGLPDGTGDEEYIDAVVNALPKAFEFNPDLVIYQSGVDGLATDKLGRLGLTHEGLQLRDRIVFESCLRAGIPCAVTLGGGYSLPIELTVAAHRNTFLCAAAVFSAHYSK